MVDRLFRAYCYEKKAEHPRNADRGSSTDSNVDGRRRHALPRSAAAPESVRGKVREARSGSGAGHNRIDKGQALRTHRSPRNLANGGPREVTGATRGIDRAISEPLLRDGAAVGNGPSTGCPAVVTGWYGVWRAGRPDSRSASSRAGRYRPARLQSARRLPWISAMAAKDIATERECSSHQWR